MAIIAEHNRTFKDTNHSLVCAWPEDCYVQWGGCGLVIGRNNSYTTAFFEAFPKPSGFIRGEGSSIADAERAAFAKYTKELGCAGHMYSRGRYLNGGGHCQRCGRWEYKAFPPVVILGSWRKPVERYFFLSEEDKLEPPRGHWRRKLWLRRKVFGETPPPPEPSE